MSRLFDLIGESLGDRTVASSSRLREDLGLDSLQLAVLTVKIEAEFGVDVFADGVVTTVGEIEEKIRRHQAEMQASKPCDDVAASAPKGDDRVERERIGE